MDVICLLSGRLGDEGVEVDVGSFQAELVGGENVSDLAEHGEHLGDVLDADGAALHAEPGTVRCDLDGGLGAGESKAATHGSNSFTPAPSRTPGCKYRCHVQASDRLFTNAVPVSIVTIGLFGYRRARISILSNRSVARLEEPLNPLSRELLPESRRRKRCASSRVMWSMPRWSKRTWSVSRR